MKLNGFVGKGSGKLGASVFAISGGEQIVREYNPNVSNPNSPAQIEQRAKLKLMSQVAAAMAAVIAMRKQGLKSARNIFIKKNFDLTTYATDTASVEYLKLQLTDGAIPMPAFEATVNTQTDKLVLDFGQNMKQIADRIVICGFEVTPENKLRFCGSSVETIAENQSEVEVDSAKVGGTIVYAYGIKDTNTAASARFQNYEVASAQHVAKLVANSTLSASDYIFTATNASEVVV